MDEYSGKRGPDGFLVSRKGSSSSLVLRETGNRKDQNGQFCNRIGCSGRLNTGKGATQIGYSGKHQSSRIASIRPSSSGKEIVGSSSRGCSAVSKNNVGRKSLVECRKKLSYRVESDSCSESAGIQDSADVPELGGGSRKVRKGSQSDPSEDHTSEIASSRQVGSSSLVASGAVSHGEFNQRSILGHPHTQASSSGSLPLKNTVQGRRSNVGRNGLRNVRCNAVSDAVSSGSDSNLNKRKDPLKERVCHGESSSSSARGNKMVSSLPEGRTSIPPTSGISISDSRRARIRPPVRDNPASSVRTRRSVTEYSYNRPRNSSSLTDPHGVVSQVPQHDTSIDLGNPTTTSSNHFFIEPSLGRPSHSRPGSSIASLRGIRSSSPTDEISNMRSLPNRESFRRYNMDGIAEVLLALERIEQDEELTYEQLLVLETNLFLSGLNFHDQHRDMRLDIDNMSYEELLALEERMGTVSTAVKEDELSDCVKTTIYHQLASIEGASRNISADMEDVKCSICQEEYGDGDELGRLRCEHGYHSSCIHQWLRLKNWCPVCKAPAVVPSESVSTTSSLPSDDS